MNERQQQLYDNLIHICEYSESFYYSDQQFKNHTFRIFNYRIASYSEFLLDDALECRGHTFRIDENGNALELVSWPLEKFFNINENPLAMNLDLNNPEYVIDKLDGSLISSYMVDGQVMLKSKGSLVSTQAEDAMNVMYNDFDHRSLKEGVMMLTMRGYTVIMEYTAPDNRIVLGYDKPKLTVLAVRNNADGEYIPWADLKEHPYNAYFENNIAECFTEKYADTMDGFVDDARAMLHIEGFIIGLKSGQRIKIKTEEYCSLHKTKDNVNSPRRLYESVVNGGSDDLKSLFADDASAIKLIVDMETLVHDKMNMVITTVNDFYNTNKLLERKDYAILGQQELERPLFGLAMQLFTGNEPDYKQFMIKQYKLFGIKDDEV